MKRILFLLLVALTAKGYGQIVCGHNPLADSVLSVAEENHLFQRIDSLYTTLGWPLPVFAYRNADGDNLTDSSAIDSLRRGFKALQKTIQSLRPDVQIDILATYHVHFVNEIDWRSNPGAIPEHNRNTLSSGGGDWEFEPLRYARAKPQGSVLWFSYGQKYLVLVHCFEYTGNSPYGNLEVYYLEKISP